MMALSGMVYKTRECGKDIVVLLAPIEDESGNTSPVGQRRLIIENFTVAPLPGDIIWGGSDSATLARGVNNKREWHYHRKGYTRLVEDFIDPEASLRRGLKDMAEGRTYPISQLWDDVEGSEE